ncbi:MAG: YbhB/YbcL family Raf kinase inhibitor-like protein [Desmonostoc vinosum HA7617-LM4]|jgi:Raf kinase inhibitor-like YbhB/YbcL family protein|nr:YbhB/YbcL family Raf kinase inhibitor-like protein [Desmonostoc vinosum HA7617-LM4]
MKLESSAFEANDIIPARYTCDGEDISPPLLWDQAPIGTESLVLIVDDPDAPGRTFVHWVVYDIPATVRQLTERIIGSWQLLVILGGERQKAEGRRQKKERNK